MYMQFNNSICSQNSRFLVIRYSNKLMFLSLIVGKEAIQRDYSRNLDRRRLRGTHHILYTDMHTYMHTYKYNYRYMYGYMYMYKYWWGANEVHFEFSTAIKLSVTEYLTAN